MRCHVIFVFLVVSNVNVSGQGFYERLTETWSRWTGRGRSSRLLEGSDEIIATYEREYLKKDFYHYFTSGDTRLWTL